MFMMHTSGGVPIRCLFFLPYLACDLRALHRGTQTRTRNESELAASRASSSRASVQTPKRVLWALLALLR